MNKQTDQHLSLAPITGGRAMDQVDILNIINENGQIEDSKDDKESTFFS